MNQECNTLQNPYGAMTQRKTEFKCLPTLYHSHHGQINTVTYTHTDTVSKTHTQRDTRNERTVTAASFGGRASLLFSRRPQEAEQRSTARECWSTASTLRNLAPRQTQTQASAHRHTDRQTNRQTERYSSSISKFYASTAMPHTQAHLLRQWQTILLRHFCDFAAVVQVSRLTYLLTYLKFVSNVLKEFLHAALQMTTWPLVTIS